MNVQPTVDGPRLRPPPLETESPPVVGETRGRLRTVSVLLAPIPPVLAIQMRCLYLELRALDASVLNKEGGHVVVGRSRSAAPA
jgi:hypothetical protein